MVEPIAINHLFYLYIDGFFLFVKIVTLKLKISLLIVEILFMRGLPVLILNLLLLLFLLVACNPLSTQSGSDRDQNFFPSIKPFDNTLIQITPIQAYVPGNEPLTILFNLPTDLAAAELELSLDNGLTFSPLATLSTSDSFYTWSIASFNTTFAQIKIKGISSTGEAVSAFSNIFVIDSTLPGAPVGTLSQGTPTNSTSAPLTISSCSDRAHIFVSESSAVPLRTDAGWQSCSTTTGAISSTFSIGDGAKILYLFAKDLAGNISSSSSVTVTLDTSLPAAPSVALSSTSITNSNNTAMTLGTCIDIHSVKVTETNTSPLASDSDWQTCSTTASAVTHTLSGTTGPRTLYIWSKDSSAQNANVSATASTVSLNLDQAPPVVSQVVINPTSSSDTVGAAYSAALAVTVRVKATDAHTIVLRILEVDSTLSCESQFTTGTWLAYSPGSPGAAVDYNLTTASPDGIKKICVWARDAAGNVSVINGSTPEAANVNRDTIIVDTAAPSSPTASLVQGTPTNNTAVPVTISSCTDRSEIFISESSTAPGLTDTGWQTCSTTASALSATLSSAQGAKTLYFYARDLAGNISTPSTVAVTFDSNPPAAPSIALSSAALTNSLNLTMTMSNCTDIHSVKITETNVAPTPGGAGWISCSTTASALTHTLSSTTQGARSVYVWAKDSSALKANVSSSGTALSFTLDQNPPALVQVVINPSNASDGIGDPYSGTANTIVRVKATDAVSTIQLRIKEVTNGLDCEPQFTTGSWLNYSPATASGPVNYSLTIAPIDGTKKMCVWAKDQAGNVSTISGSTPETANVNFDTIGYEVGNIPKILTFSALNDSGSIRQGTTEFQVGEEVKIDFSVSDVEGLNNNPISISYTTNNTLWKDIYTDSDISVPANVTWFGGLNGNPLTHSGSVDFSAPSNGYFKIKLVVKDRSGNTAVPAYSDAMNGKPWSIYAGSNDNGDGGTALAARINTGDHNGPYFAISPINNDLYVIDETTGNRAVRKLDAKTGIVSTFIKHATILSNLTDGGTIPASINVNNPTAIRFDSKGRLYVSTNLQMWQFDFETNKTRIYLGATQNNASSSATHLNVSWVRHSFTLDEDDSLYFFANCLPWNGQRAVRLMKLTQNTDGSPKDVSIIAGTCMEGTPTGNGPHDPLSIPLGTSYDASLAVMAPSFSISSIAAFGRGRYIYFHYYANGNVGVSKIIDGQWYKSSVDYGGTTPYFYNRHNGKLYQAQALIKEYTLNLTGALGDTGTTIVTSSSSSSTCDEDNDPTPLQACVRSGIGFDVTNSGLLLFGDGGSRSSYGTFRIRYIDPSSNKLKTLLGSKSFFGNGLTKDLLRGDIAGIHYKKASDPNPSTTAAPTAPGNFPEGLYFIDKTAMVIGKINPSTQITNILYGNQIRSSASFPVNAVMGPSRTLGIPEGSPHAHALAFDKDGLPWFILESRLYSIDKDNKIVHRMAPSAVIPWANAIEDAIPANYRLSILGGVNNLVLSNHGPILIGVATDTPGTPAVNNIHPSIRHFDMTLNKTKVLMGDVPRASAPDTNPVTNPGPIKNFPVGCQYSSNIVVGRFCFIHYDRTNDIIYYSENNVAKIRYITKAINDPANSELKTITLARVPTNFTIRPNGSEVYYLSDAGQIYCKAITSASTCVDTHVTNDSLGPNSAIGTISRGPNQFTWADNNSLLISTYLGVVLKYQIAP